MTDSGQEQLAEDNMSEETREIGSEMEYQGPFALLGVLGVLVFLSGLLFYLGCYFAGRTFFVYYSLQMYQQCLPALFLFCSAFMFYRLGTPLQLWGSALIIAGLTPFVSWFASVANGGLLFEINIWLLVAALPLMLHAYIQYLLQAAGKLRTFGPVKRMFLEGQSKMILYTMVIPFGAFAGSCLISRNFVLQGLIRQIFSGDYWVISRYLAVIIGIDLSMLIVDSLLFLLSVPQGHRR